MGATNVLDRLSASVGLVNGVPTRFKHCLDVSNAGVLFALPALLSNGLLQDIEKYFSLPSGYYTLPQIFLLMAFLALCRVKTYEQLRYHSPGEWGKILGLDRIPEVKTLRKKIDNLSKHNNAEQWSGELCQQWMNGNASDAGVLYIDGHVRVYHGKMTKLPRHYVARQRLCLRATVDYWVNTVDGKPFFRVNQAVDPGILQVLRSEIIPVLEKDVPQQPTDEELFQAPLLHRFVIVVDREGYSPDFFKELKEKRIAIITYHKFPKDAWDINEFCPYLIDQSDGSQEKVMLAERGTRLSNKLWVREMRKLTKSGHQTSLLTTDYQSELAPIAVRLFSRWCQENFFKYMRENYNLDKLIEYSTESIPDTTKVVNPAYRDINSQIRKQNATLGKVTKKFSSLILTDDIESPKVDKYEQDKAELKLQIEHLQVHIEKLKEDRKKINPHIQFGELPKDQQFKGLKTESKHLVDTVKIIAYRAETALSQTIKEYLTDPEDARPLIKKIITSDADILPDEKQNILTIRLHHQASRAQDEAVKKMCEELNETKITFPGSQMEMRYELISEPGVENALAEKNGS